MVSKINSYKEDRNVMSDAFDIYMAASFRELGADLYEADCKNENRSMRLYFHDLRKHSDNARGIKKTDEANCSDLFFDPINPMWAD